MTAVGVFAADLSEIRLISYRIVTIPEPSSVALLLGALVGLGVVLLRRL
ncbi:PEP-CTERM sorting domain-containing protein [Coraliomargarita sp. W4R53]